MTDDSGVEFGQTAREAIIKAFFDVVAVIASRRGWDTEAIHVSRTALSLALAESAKDIKAMQMRRNPGEISSGKIAGIVTFRLARWNPIHLSGELIEDPTANKLNALVAFALSLKHFLGANILDFPSGVTSEIQYTLLRRHTNQETLGLAFDVLDFHIEKSKIY